MAEKVYIDPSAVVLGNVTLANGVSIWPCAVIRGDLNAIVIGENSNVQDTAVIHASHDYPTYIGRDTTIGHGAVINGAVIGNNCLIGINSTILDGASIGDECIIGANAIVTSKTEIPPKSVVMGVPGKVVKANDPSILETAQRSSLSYQTLRDDYISGKYKRRTF
ncbi:MAG: Carbonic anhydrase precursor [Methanomassiliicoccales archaeon PtaU1.Bin124]|nr:MAG: Carbonic anhydrase precursor [Methanomassiliicoccales archaeon PtaU1.Bin124]